MTKRDRLEAKAQKIMAQMEALKTKYMEVQIQHALLCDKKQWFTEKEETIIISRRPKKTETRLIGRIHWREFFQDMDYPDDKTKGVWIERSRAVRVNGVWTW